MIRKHVYYSGRVQGVGFRYTTVRIAAGYNVTGYVRNMMDGRVEVVVEGPVDQVQAFLTAVAEAMAGYVRDTKQVQEPYSGKITEFGIKF